ncbi:EAL domain-containing response regulator [Paraburkholderia bryophila]|uniref:EAL domain-containing protein (Putative c-di-GMP-specific phosphodiesterase class I)/ActR/RegA family two-component response regulator n=1 Tax=Paraburkholderia bryophila TaxID=420952 RepID=A0A7Z0B5S1_9BURK|nr:EAL domain-containing response regulator [Paraburkholderia bryophila]NYH21035.1 EAL domain-containing protein (putative c-di-GMP-specific phosphodiesterase class I)/ActR/RegA family two-component response regulator [Paraburkholderia bryophila]
MSDLHNETRGSVLIVEDDPVQLKFLSAMTRKLGMASFAAATVQQATALLSREVIGMVLLDLQLGNEAGLDVLRELGRGNAACPVAFISGCDERTRTAATGIAQAHGIHVAGSLGKPARFEQLAALLQATPASAWRPAQREAPRVTAQDLAAAIGARQIRAAFQPKIDLSSGLPIGVEALARWNSPLFGAVPPDVFIPLAEATGQIRALTELMLTASLQACTRWRHEFPELTVAINVSPSIVDHETLAVITRLLAENGVPAQSLVVEITESSVIGDSALASDVLTRLRIAGVQLSIDDFGTGHSSLVSLLRMPFNELKLDRLFVSTSVQNPDAERILGSLIALARQMGLRSVAEGVETEDVYRRLLAHGCDAGQGWLWSPALSEADLLGWLAGRGACTHEVASGSVV